MSDIPGSVLEFDFAGSYLGVYWAASPDSGMIEYTIDDGEVKKATGWDRYAEKYSRPAASILSEELPAGNHHAVIKVSEEKAEKSTGYKICIAAFLCEPPKPNME